MATNKNILTDVEGFVIGDLKYGNSSKILKLFTKQLGKIPVMSQGAMRKSSERAGLSNLYSLCRYSLSKGRTFYYINSGEMVNSYIKLSSDIRSLLVASFICELLDKSLPEECPVTDVFELTKKNFDAIVSGGIDHTVLLISFALKYSSFMGYRPSFNADVSFGYGHLDLVNSNISSAELSFLKSCLYSPTGSIKSAVGMEESSKRMLQIALNYLYSSLEIQGIKTTEWMSKVGIL